MVCLWICWTGALGQLQFYSFSYNFYRCLIVKTETYARPEIAKVVQLRANVEGLKLGPGVLDKLAEEGEKTSLRYEHPTSTLVHSMTNHCIPC